MLWVVNLLVFLSSVLWAVLVMRAVYSDTMLVQSRLERLRQADLPAADREDKMRQPFLSRVIRPALLALGNTLGRLTPREIRQKTEQRLVYAGNPYRLTAGSFIALQLLAGLLFLLAGVALVIFANVDGSQAFFLAALAACIGALLPSSLLNAAVRKRQAQIQKSLPDTLDLLLVSVEAGLSFDMALKRVAEQKTGILSDEIVRMLEEIRLGKVREEALRSLVRRTGVRDLSTFVGAIIQSERLGTNLAGTLRVQAGAIRLKRKQKVEEAAMKAPIKMLFPMIFLIFPALFVVLLGPTVIRLLETFRKMF